MNFCEGRLYFGADSHSYLHSDLDPCRILYLLRLFAKERYFTRCQHYNTDDFSNDPDSNIVYQIVYHRIYCFE